MRGLENAPRFPRPSKLLPSARKSLSFARGKQENQPGCAQPYRPFGLPILAAMAPFLCYIAAATGGVDRRDPATKRPKRTQKSPGPDPTPRERFANRQWGSMGLRVQLACKHKDRKRRGKRKRVEIRGRTHPSHHHSHRYSPEHYVGRAKGSGSGRESALTRRGKWRQAQPGDYLRGVNV